jgi:hypothetical protein
MEIEIQRGGVKIEPVVKLEIGDFKLSAILSMGVARYEAFKATLSPADAKKVEDAYRALISGMAGE